MSLGLVGKKCGMTRIFADNGAAIPVTVVQIQPNRVTQIKTPQNEGYFAVQIATGEQKASQVNKAMAGHLGKAKVESGRWLYEFRLEENEIKGVKLGDEINIDLFKEGQLIDVIGVSKGKGFAGVVKRHNFRTQDASHGNSLSHRVPGSIGQCQTPGRVHKGKKLPGHMGSRHSTVQNQEIIRIDDKHRLLLIKGSVPGAKNSMVVVSLAAKVAQSQQIEGEK